MNGSVNNVQYQNDNPYIFIRSTPGLNQYNNTSIAMLSPKMVPTTTISQSINNTTIMQSSQPQVTVQPNASLNLSAPATNNGKMPAVLLVQQPHITITNPSTNVVPMYTLAANMESNINSKLDIEELKDKLNDPMKSSEFTTADDDEIKLLEQRLNAVSLDKENKTKSQQNSSSSESSEDEEMENGTSDDEDAHLRPINQKEQNYIKTTTTTASGTVITQMKPIGKSKGKQNAYTSETSYSSYKPMKPTVSYQEALFDIVDTDDLMVDDVILNDDEILINNEEEKPTYTSFSANKSKTQNMYNGSNSSCSGSVSSSATSSPVPFHNDKTNKRSTIAMLPKSRYSVFQTESPLVNHAFNDTDPDSKKYINSSVEPSPKPESNTTATPLFDIKQKEYHHNLIEKMIEILNQKKQMAAK